jgi:hypothetical protein
MIATSWVNQETSEWMSLWWTRPYILAIALIIHWLICPNQLRSFGIVVDDTPKQFSPKLTHSIELPGTI